MLRTLALSFVILSTGVAFAQAPTQRIRGDAVGLDGQMLQVKQRTGEMVSIKLAENYAVTAVAKAGIEAITPNSYVGAATMPLADGTQSALEVLIFPESARGSGEGHYAWDLQPGSMMTNATVSEVVGVDSGRRMRLKYKDGEKVIVIPANAPIVTMEPADRSMLKPGAHVMLTATRQPDGSLTAARVTVGKDGIVPPM